ncbi:helix-turn-helix domain-containing protein [Streptosporangium roseum]|uniref:helix-turn-helix domain-containing protein n=1 Tax=Streptosporangium roseum TaxID=2001 RepID=UPI00331F58EA
MSTLSERLTRALAEKGVSDRQAARDIRAAGFPITHAYISQLKKSRTTNPGLDVLTALARYLGTTVGWLAGDPDPVENPVADGAAVDQATQVQEGLAALGVQNLAERTAGLSPLSLDAISQMIEAMRAAEGLHRNTETPPDRR